MLTNIQTQVVIVLLLFAVTAKSLSCPLNSVPLNDSCTACASLTNTEPDQSLNVLNECICLQGYQWSSYDTKCQISVDNNQSSNSNANSSYENTSFDNITDELNTTVICALQNCLICLNYACLQCAPNYELNSSSNQCILPLCQTLNCIACFNSSSCQFCDLSYFLDSNGIHCSPCCQGCQICSNESSCLSCFAFYTLSNSLCYQQTCNITNCLICSGKYCAFCLLGYQLYKNGQFCYKSPQICDGNHCVSLCNDQDCSNVQKCSSCGDCSPGFSALYINGQYVCIQGHQSTCSTPNCKNCTFFTCSVCQDGYFIDGRYCTLNYCTIVHCVICNSTSSCGQCQSNYVYNYTTSQCIPVCLPQSPKCLSCKNATFCSVCQPGYKMLNTQLSLCTPLCTIDNCYLCLASNTCSQCLQGYQINANQSSCHLLCTVINCNNCQNSTLCLGCTPGFSLINNTCIRNCAVGSISIANGSNISCYACSRINSLCLACISVNNSFICNNCSAVAYLSNNNSCIMCNSSLRNCIRCISSSQCLNCAYPYSLVNKVCVSVLCKVANCLLCSKYSPSTCTLCSPGSTFVASSLCWPLQCPSNFVLSDGVCLCPLFSMISGAACVSCASSHCISCSQLGCLSCSNGFYLAFNQSCVPCAINCALCASIICTQCSYGFSLQNDGSCLQVGGGISSVKINGQFVPCGPGCSVCAAGIFNEIICLKPWVGYSVSIGTVSKCSHQSCLTCIHATTICTSCFDGHTLIGGNCASCLDPNAISCLSTNLNYSITCAPKYSIGTLDSNLGRYCLPCAANCLKCDFNGPNNCDSYQCMIGFVQLKGSLDCSACFNSCSVCDQNDLNLCLDCGLYRYRDDQGSCQSCAVRCRVCISAENCSVCQLGYTLINGLCQVSLSYPCALTRSNSKCKECFRDYILNDTDCMLEPPHDNSGNYTECPYGYLLADSLCFPCLVSNCLACDESNQCTFCKKGYFLFLGGCSSCRDNCLDCISPTYCNQAADGYYLSNHVDGSSRGVVVKCSSPCQTCIYGPEYCLTCIDGYSIAGGACISNNVLTVQIVLAPSQISQSSVFSSLDTDYIQLAKTIRDVNRLVNSFCQILETSLLANSSCSQSFSIRSIKLGSIVMNIAVDANRVNDVSSTEQSIYQGLTSNGMDGFSIVSATVTQSYSLNNVDPHTSPSFADSSQTSKLPLILGVSIGVGVLVIIVLLIVIAIKRKNSEQAPPSNSVEVIRQYIEENNFQKNGEKDPQFHFTPNVLLSVGEPSNLNGEQNKSASHNEEEEDDDDDEIENCPRPRTESRRKKVKRSVRKVKLLQKTIETMIPS